MWNDKKKKKKISPGVLRINYPVKSTYDFFFFSRICLERFRVMFYDG